MNSRAVAGGLGLAVAIAVSLPATAPLAHAVPMEQATGLDHPTSATPPPDDFNGDGYRDIAVTAPLATVNGHARAGYVAVLYGSAHGPHASAKQIFDQDKPGMPGVAETDDHYGSSVTSADLDQDGYADLVVGSAGENSETGSLAAIWGGPHGLSGSITLLPTADMRADQVEFAGIGESVVAGDVNGDDRPEVLTTHYGDLQVLAGPFDRQGTPSGGVHDVANPLDHGITDLAVGDLNGDDIMDIASEGHLSDGPDTRSITYWLGSRNGLTKEVALDNAGGENLDIGDVNGDGYGDIISGRARGNTDTDTIDPPESKGGMITYVPGGAKGPDGARAKTFNQDSPGMPGFAEQDDPSDGSEGFGAGVSVGDIDGDGYADVAVGVDGESFNGKKQAGRVLTLRGTADGPTGVGARSFSQDTRGVPGVAESGDLFGAANKLVDTNGDGKADLFTSAPYENHEKDSNWPGAGAVWVFRSTASGVTASGSFSFDAGTLGTVAARAMLGAAFDF